MTRTTRITLVLTALLSSGLSAQERLGTGAAEPVYRAGWTFTPAFGFAETYDDNVSLFGEGSADDQNDDYLSTIFPGANVHYAGKHTSMHVGYMGTFLNYQTFSVLNRWDQQANFELRRQETARLKWFGNASAAAVPTTDLIELGGLPFRHTGALTADGRGGYEYAFSAKNSIRQSASYQAIDFDRDEDVSLGLLGGRIFESMNGWRHRIDSRLAVGADYSFRRSLVVGDPDPFNIHTTEGAVDYELSPDWSFSGGAGVVYLQATPLTEARTGPSWRARIDRLHGRTLFHVGYLRSYIPSFGFGGTVQNQEMGVGYRTPLFGSRHFYSDNSAVFRDDQPLSSVQQQLPLRSLRFYTTFGWEPQPWVRLEAFYQRIQQTSLRPGGRMERNRIGFQIVTSKPVRMQ
jgi:hypothetical protein